MKCFVAEKKHKTEFQLTDSDPLIL